MSPMSPNSQTFVNCLKDMLELDSKYFAPCPDSIQACTHCFKNTIYKSFWKYTVKVWLIIEFLEGIFNLVLLLKILFKSPSPIFKVKNWGSVIWFDFLRMLSNWKYLMRLPHLYYWHPRTRKANLLNWSRGNCFGVCRKISRKRCHFKIMLFLELGSRNFFATSTIWCL